MQVLGVCTILMAGLDVYTYLSVKGGHIVIKKEDGIPKAKGRDHINGVEGFWSFSKSWLYQYRGIPGIISACI